MKAFVIDLTAFADHLKNLPKQEGRTQVEVLLEDIKDAFESEYKAEHWKWVSVDGLPVMAVDAEQLID